MIFRPYDDGLAGVILHGWDPHPFVMLVRPPVYEIDRGASA